MSSTQTEGSSSSAQTPNSSSKSPASTHTFASSTQTNTEAPTTDAATARAAVQASLSSVGASYDADLKQRVADLHTNSQALAKQEKDLAKATAALERESKKWAKMADKTTKQLNEFGDVQNWAEVLERDLVVLEETMRLVEGRENEGNASGVNIARPLG